MSTSMDLSQYTEEQVRASLAQYIDAFEKANEMIKSDKEVIKNLNEKILLLENEKTSDSGEATKLQEQIKTQLNEIEKLTSQISTLTAELNMSQSSNLESLQLIEDLNKQIVKLNKQKTISLDEPIKTGKTAMGNYTYNILGWDNRTGKKLNGGETYVKAIVITSVEKIEDQFNIHWEVVSKDLELDTTNKITIDENEREHFDELILNFGLYDALKMYLEIPDTVENDFGDIKLLRK